VILHCGEINGKAIGVTKPYLCQKDLVFGLSYKPSFPARTSFSLHFSRYIPTISDYSWQKTLSHYSTDPFLNQLK